MARKRPAKRAGKNAYRSKFEQRLGDGLDKRGIKYGYETETFKITVPVKGVRCVPCKSKLVVRDTRFTPDFIFKNYIVEAKGRFTGNDRKRALALRAALYDAKDKRLFVMLFMRNNKLSKTSKTYYSEWCDQHGIPWRVGEFAEEWLK